MVTFFCVSLDFTNIKLTPLAVTFRKVVFGDPALELDI
jgi:hypothetical protein